MRAMTKGGLAAAALLLGAMAAGAQEPAATDGRWLALVGCWQPVGPGGPAAVCVLPAGGAAVEIVTVAGGQVRERERVDAGGAAQPAGREGCTGTDQARWSADGRRVYLRSAHRCDGVELGATGIIAMASPDEWLDVRGASLAGGPPDVRVRRYRALLDRTTLPADVAARLAAAERPAMQPAARAAAATAITVAEVTEASREVAAPVAEAWVLARGQQLAIDARRLERMADDEVPERVIDAVVAVSFPRHFAISGTEVEPAVAAPDTTPRPLTTPIYGGTSLDRPLYCSSVMYSSRRECWDNGMLGYGPFDYGRYGTYGYGPYGYPYGGGAWGNNPYGAPVVVVREGEQGPRGRAVKGKGYTRADGDGASSGGSARPRTERTTSGGSSASSGSGSRGSSSSSGSSGRSTERSSGGSSSSTGRTARPKSP